MRAEYRGLPAVPADQVVTGLIPHEPPNFQTPATLSLLNEAVCVVTGQRGVGKTQLAAAYARQRVSDGWLVAWIGAETADQIKAGMVELADRLSLYRPEDSAEVTAVRVRNHLQTWTGNALLVFDNVVALDAVRPYLPSTGSAQVVITSTVRGSQVGREVPVEVFTPEAALRFLRDATGLTADAAELAREVGYLPLALAQAAARIRAGRWDCAKYLENFRAFPAEKYLSRRDGDPYPLGAATAILMALEPFQGSVLVEMLSVLSPDGVSREVLGDDADDELVRLREASVVEFAGDSSVIMHRLVQRVIRDRGHHRSLTRAAGLIAERVGFDNTWSNRRLGKELVRQIEALWANTGPSDPVEVSEPVIHLRLWEIHFLVSIAEFSQANLVAEDLYTEVGIRLGEDHPLVSQARRRISSDLDYVPESLLSQLHNDLATFRDELGADHPTVLETALHLGRCYLKLERADEAIAVLEQTPSTNAVIELGFAYIMAGRADEAVALLEQPVGDDALAPSRLQLGRAYAQLGRNEDARVAYEQAWDRYRRTFGPDHPLTLYSACQLGTALDKCGEKEQARALLLITRAIADQTLGHDHRVTQAVRSALMSVRQD